MPQEGIEERQKMKAWQVLLGIGAVIGGVMIYGNMNSSGDSTAPISGQLSATGIRFFRDGKLLRQFDVPPGAPTIEDTLYKRTFVEWSTTVAAWMLDNIKRDIAIVAIDDQERTETLARDLGISLAVEAKDRGVKPSWGVSFA